MKILVNLSINGKRFQKELRRIKISSKMTGFS